MPLVGALILPHGALTLDGNLNSESEECKERFKNLPDNIQGQISDLYNGSCEAAAQTAALDPDIIILSTPHGFKLTESLAIYLNDKCGGTAEWAGHWKEFRVDIDLDSSVAEHLLKHLREKGVSAEGLMGFGGAPRSSYKPMPLAWGEAIPAYFLNNYVKKDVKYLIISHPKKPGTADQDQLDIGLAVSTFVEEHLQDQRVVLAISGDLSHCYEPQYKGQPLYLPLPIIQDDLKPKHTEATLFERATKGWVLSIGDKTLCNTNSDLPNFGSAATSWIPEEALPWLQRAAELQPIARSCGLNGFSLLHGALTHITGKGKSVSASLMTVQAPTYYGMMAATFNVC